MLAPGDRDAESPVVRWHDKTNKEWPTFRGYVTTHYPEPKSLEDWVYYSQLNQRDALRFGIEHYRRSEFCRGTLIWQFNDCWPVQSWAVQDYARLLKPAGYELARLYADHLLSLVVTEESVDVHLVNDGPTDLKGTLLLEVLSTTSGEARVRRQARVEMSAGARGVVCSESLSGLEATSHFVRATVTTEPGVCSAVALLAEPKKMHLAPPQLSATVGEQIALHVDGVAIDLVLYDPDDSANVRPGVLRLPGWSAATLINETRGYSFVQRPRRLAAQSLEGTHEVTILGQSILMTNRRRITFRA